MRCLSCGFTNDDNNKICINCGGEIYTVSDSGYLRKAPNLKPLWITVGIIIVLILTAISYDLIFHKYPDNSQIQTGDKSSDIFLNPVIKAQVTSIASKFVCSCRNPDCNKTSLESCTCNTAAAERQFISEKLEQNNKPDDIVVLLANKYGFLKSEFASKYKIASDKIRYQN